jgi:kynurenine formamidase
MGTRAVCWVVLVLAGLGCRASPPPAALATPAHLVDLTHTLSPQFPYIPIGALTFPIRITPIGNFDRDGVYANKWELTEHNGTHIDAPNHFAAAARGLDQLSARELWVPAAVIDLRAAVARDPDVQLGVADLVAWERAHGRLPAGAAVLLWTGWESRAQSQAAFVNADAQGRMHFPGFSVAAVDFLVRERQVSGIGTDTLSLDRGLDPSFAAHRALFTADKWGLECLANLGQLPPLGATLIVGATKVQKASGGPARVFAAW